eukprot:CAMPEP_0119553090 /NCGR_PEP_ID=MMETSP1352-20130426/5927_1 /TAXON_ID=265584 /ORGANISM="Stauroneis constricta, Strain CCMP1120" /LENGTH=91 /DNA_ID=CAMNT_0007599433 /DNA_START=11 /DNA_END=282 /DNA_ORIENTATION=+
MYRTILSLLALACVTSDLGASAFAPRAFAVARNQHASSSSPSTAVRMSDDFIQETPDATRERLEALVENHPVLLFMKGSKLFPQCGFSNTA